MPARRGEPQIFSLSFLDVLSCALGGVLLLLLLNIDSGHKQAESHRRQATSMQNQINDALGRVAAAQKGLAAAHKAAANAQARADAQEAAMDGMKKAQAALIGLNGDMNGAVFIFDTSGSMKETGRYEEYKALLKGWLTHVPFKRFNVIRFSDDAEVWHPGELVDGEDPDRRREALANREEACAFVDRFVPEGSTHTREALEAAFALPDVDTITLMSDGRPTPGGLEEMESIHLRLREVNANRQVVVNCVAMGDYFGKDYAEFLQKIAHDHGGMFIGR